MAARRMVRGKDSILKNSSVSKMAAQQALAFLQNASPDTFSEVQLICRYIFRGSVGFKKAVECTLGRQFLKRVSQLHRALTLFPGGSCGARSSPSWKWRCTSTSTRERLRPR